MLGRSPAILRARKRRLHLAAAVLQRRRAAVIEVEVGDEDLVDVLRLDACRSEIPHQRAALKYADLHRSDAGIDQYALLAGPHDEAAVLEHHVAVVVQPAL